MPKAASVFSPFIGLPLILSVMCTCSFFVFLPGICAGSSTRGDAIIGMASAMHRMCLVGCQKQQWFNEIVRDGGRVKLAMTLQQCGIAFAGNCAPSAIGVSIPPGASAFIRMVDCICSIACELVRLSRPRSEEHTSELQSLMRISYAVFCLKKKKKQHN